LQRDELPKFLEGERMLSKNLILLSMVLSANAFAGNVQSDSAPITLGCEAHGQYSKLVATNASTGQKIQAGSFQGGGWSNSQATRDAAQGCLAAMIAQNDCVNQRMAVWGCQADGQKSKLIYTNLATGKQVDVGSFEGGGLSALSATREAARICLMALLSQGTCHDTEE
jgi:hypothetical protein